MKGRNLYRRRAKLLIGPRRVFTLKGRLTRLAVINAIVPAFW
ncbi:MAG TPA: hypothetical protein VG269_02810 [Tepidisphaeraceae bacterium]|nr:hypothetical protein [Tepidisphaeraceae bacterium]